MCVGRDLAMSRSPFKNILPDPKHLLSELIPNSNSPKAVIRENLRRSSFGLSEVTFPLKKIFVFWRTSPIGWDLRFSRRRLWRWLSSGMLRRGRCPDDGDSKHLWNVCKLLPDCTAQHSTRQSILRRHSLPHIFGLSEAAFAFKKTFAFLTHSSH
jgi:hypothetical protein